MSIGYTRTVFVEVKTVLWWETFPGSKSPGTRTLKRKGLMGRMVVDGLQ